MANSKLCCFVVHSCRSGSPSSLLISGSHLFKWMYMIIEYNYIISIQCISDPVNVIRGVPQGLGNGVKF